MKGDVEVDETFIGGEESGLKSDGKKKTGRGSIEKILVEVATEYNGKQIGRVRFKCIESAKRKSDQVLPLYLIQKTLGMKRRLSQVAAWKPPNCYHMSILLIHC